MRVRSGFIASVVIAAVAVLSAQSVPGPTSPPAQPAGASGLRVNPLKPGKVYWVAGGGGNSGVIIGDTGVIVVDAKTTPAAAQLLIAEVGKLTPKPITHVVLTHSDADHVNGLPGFPAGVTIIGHANNRLEQQAVLQSATVEVNGGRCVPPADRLPTRIVRAPRVATRINGVTLVFHHFGPAHTSGDLVIELPDDKVAFAGDLLTNLVLVHPIKHGSFAGWFASAQGLLDLDVEQYIAGHANVPDTKDTIRKRIAEYTVVRERVAALVTEGKTLPEVKTAFGDPERGQLGCRGFAWSTVPELAYQDQLDQRQELK